ncbi:hypothetical protein J0A67_04805 [Algoriphagus aestuariicola]|uniref:Uncharacterized protein n=1 Tax=Algoriphagus aestuariicola TaxID=1852016 RepID=A0ABS3BLX3_9BACT|nr:hypothetical protein [Algoriphagus aestuariicola]MBN7800168.1 hypothetical protein [Algoriphagus aestuariicola]
MRVVLFILLILLSFQGFAQEADSLEGQKAEKSVQIPGETDSKDAETAEDQEPKKEDESDLNFGFWLYILMPVILTFSSAFYFIGWLKKEGFRISNALSDDVPEERLQQAQTVQARLVQARANMIAANAADPGQAQPVPPMPSPEQSTIPMNRSSSRLIAFLSSMSASILAICIFSYYMYFAIRGMTVPEFEDLWPILTALGLGIVPYGTKVVSGKSAT